MKEFQHSRSHYSRQFSLTATPREIFGPSDRRVGVLIAPPVRGTVYIGGDATITVGNGIPIKSTDEPLYLGIENVGDMVKRGLWAVGSPAISDVNVGPIGQLTDVTNAAAPAVTQAILTPAAGNHLRVTFFNASVNVAEAFNYGLADGGALNYISGWAYTSQVASFDAPIIFPTSSAATLTVVQSATSTLAFATLHAYEYSGPATINTTVNLTVVEIFRCDYTPNVEQIMANLKV